MEVLIDARQRVRKSIGSARLITIKANVTVDEEVTDPKLLDGIGTYGAITRSSPSITESLNASEGRNFSQSAFVPLGKKHCILIRKEQEHLAEVLDNMT